MKKLLSIILAAAILISLIPAVFAAHTETEPEVKIVYDFYNAELAGLVEDAEFDLNKLSFAASKGFWQFADTFNNKEVVLTNSGTGFRADDGYIKNIARNEDASQKYWIAYKLYVPISGNYDIEITAKAASYYNQTWIEAYFFKADSVTDVSDGVTVENRIRDIKKKFSANGVDEEHKIGSMDFDAGEYYFVFMPSTNRTSSGKPTNGGYVFLKYLTLTENGTGEALVPIISSLASKTEDGATNVKAEATLMSDAKTPATDVSYSYAVASDDAHLAEVDANGVVTGKADGTATIIATATKNGLSSSKSIEVVVSAPATEPEEDKELTDAFKVIEKKEENYTEPSVITVSVNNADIDSVKNVDGTHTITAPETNADGKKFLYWAKGLTANKKIISFSNILSDYVPDEKYANYLIAIYEGEEAKTSEYYNANGQLIGTKEAPDLPSMAGYGTAKEWKKYGETNIHVAQYELTTPLKNISVTVEGGLGGGTYAYGEKVTCTADGEGTFKCWKKSNINGKTEIVSRSLVYTFKAWEDCTVTAEYEEHNYSGNERKIVIDSFGVGDEIGVMAEFIGFDNAVEKGIIWKTATDETRIAMTAPGNQFTVIADENGEYIGYAILKNGNAYTLITDGTYTHQ